MRCFSPISAWQTDFGEIVFVERGSIRRALTLPCGQCIGCRLNRSRVWAMRCMHEAQLYDMSSFITLTYAPEHCPTSLKYSHFQKFMKRLRKVKGPSRFFMCGEYGEKLDRPHFHACLFGVHFEDRTIWSESNGIRLYRSETLERLWPFGFALIGDVTFDSAAYVARYVMKKVTGDAAAEHYLKVDLSTGELVQVKAEFCRMSLKPGIGKDWIEKFHKDVYSDDKDYVVINGSKFKPPRYYDQFIMGKDVDLYEGLEYNRYVRSGRCVDDNTPERLEVQRQVAEAKLTVKKRSLHQ